VGLDQVTGAVTGTWWADANHGNGGGIWTSPAYDAASNRIFVATGNVDLGVDPKTVPWQQAIVAIDPTTMLTVDFFQPIHTDFSTDWDFGGSPTLYDLADGRHLIADTNKNGNVYALDRDHLANGVLWTTEISAPGESPDLGESTIVSPVYANGLLFVGGGTTTDKQLGAIAALNAATGAVVWKMNPDGFVLPALAAMGEVVAAAVSRNADNTGQLLIFNQANGEVLFSLATAGRLFAEPTWANGTLYLVDLAGNLYALRP
jgi:outer membrane protein assembly factor BamB